MWTELLTRSVRSRREANRGSGRRAMGNETRLYKEAAA
jgi:hypothetical protein